MDAIEGFGEAFVGERIGKAELHGFIVYPTFEEPAASYAPGGIEDRGVRLGNCVEVSGPWGDAEHSWSSLREL